MGQVWRAQSPNGEFGDFQRNLNVGPSLEMMDPRGGFLTGNAAKPNGSINCSGSAPKSHDLTCSRKSASLSIHNPEKR